MTIQLNLFFVACAFIDMHMLHTSCAHDDMIVKDCSR